MNYANLPKSARLITSILPCLAFQITIATSIFFSTVRKETLMSIIIIASREEKYSVMTKLKRI